MTALLLATPWLGLLLFVVVVARSPSELPRPERTGSTGRRAQEEREEIGKGRRPSVSVIVPARNEELDIVECVRSIAASDYPDFEIIVVDDGSEDETFRLASSVAAGNARRIDVVRGASLPEGWLGKPWACHQGFERASGHFLLFTDADTTHGPELLARAVTAFEEERADLLTVIGRQIMETFWERLVQPQVFFMMLLRFPDFEAIARNDRWRDAIANGQYLLFSRSAYDAIGGHEAVQGEVAEDLVLAQNVKRAGLRLRIRSAEDDFATRMYRSLAELVEGWSKNIVTGGLQSLPPWVRPVAAPAGLLWSFVLSLTAPALLVASIAGVALTGTPANPDLLIWSVAVYVISVIMWAYFSARMGVPAWYGLAYPLGAAVVSYIMLKSWIAGRDVEWKGRRYRLRSLEERS